MPNRYMPENSAIACILLRNINISFADCIIVFYIVSVVIRNKIRILKKNGLTAD